MRIMNDFEREYPPAIEKQLVELARRLRLPNMRQVILDRVLSAKERKSIQADSSAAEDIVQIYAGLRRKRPLLAVVELALATEMMTNLQYDWLLRDLGEHPSSPKSMDHPEWNPDRGELSWKGKVVRRVRPNGFNLILILDAFQQQGWPECIDDPLPGSRDPERRREAIRKLNAKLEKLRFEAVPDGVRIRWKATSGHARATRRP